MNGIVRAFLCCQLIVVLFIGLHDWIPLGRLNNLAGIRAVDTTRKLLFATVLSTLPFAIGFAASVYYARMGFPAWLMWFLWISYSLALYGLLKAWWVPYLFVADSERATRYKERFAHTHSFLPGRNGIRPDTLHVCFHVVVVVLLILLADLTFAQHAMP